MVRDIGASMASVEVLGATAVGADYVYLGSRDGRGAPLTWIDGATGKHDASQASPGVRSVRSSLRWEPGPSSPAPRRVTARSPGSATGRGRARRCSRTSPVDAPRTPVLLALSATRMRPISALTRSCRSKRPPTSQRATRTADASCGARTGPGPARVLSRTSGRAGRRDPRECAPARAGDALYFAADDGGHGSELWRSDGTRTGTRMVKDIGPGSSVAWWDAPVPSDGRRPRVLPR